MPIKPYPEKTIREKILNKIKPKAKRGNSPHIKGYIYIDDKVVTKVTIPNSHNRIMKESKSSLIATQLKLTCDQFNDLIECPLRGPEYFEILKEKVK